MRGEIAMAFDYGQSVYLKNSFKTFKQFKPFKSFSEVLNGLNVLNGC